jgi:hypothetical protein
MDSVFETEFLVPDIWSAIAKHLPDTDILKLRLVSKSFKRGVELDDRWNARLTSIGIRPADDRQPLVQYLKVLKDGLGWKNKEYTASHYDMHNSFVMGVDFNADVLVTCGGINDGRDIVWHWKESGLEQHGVGAQHNAAAISVHPFPLWQC